MTIDAEAIQGLNSRKILLVRNMSDTPDQSLNEGELPSTCSLDEIVASLFGPFNPDATWDELGMSSTTSA